MQTPNNMMMEGTKDGRSDGVYCRSKSQSIDGFRSREIDVSRGFLEILSSPLDEDPMTKHG